MYQRALLSYILSVNNYHKINCSNKLKDMFKNIFGGSKKRKSGVYTFENGKLVEFDESPGNGSVNAIIESLGYDINQIHSIWTFDSNKISNIGVKVLSKIPVFVITENGVSNLNLMTLNRALAKIDWRFEYESTVVEDILNEGIENENLSLNFLSKATKLVQKSNNIYKAENFGLLLHFEEEKLVRFTSSDGLTAESRWLKELNPSLFNSMLDEARQFQDSEMDALEEVHNQCVALRSIPDAFKNQFLSQHINEYGNYNFYNLNAAHYSPTITKKTFIKTNKGRYIQLGQYQLRVQDYTYNFGEDGLLMDAWKN